MSQTKVVVVPVRGLGGVRWMLRRAGYGLVGLGWARFDGTFTPGTQPYNEASGDYVVSSPLCDEMIEFAREQGWAVVADEKGVLRG